MKLGEWPLMMEAHYDIVRGFGVGCERLVQVCSWENRNREKGTPVLPVAHRQELREKPLANVLFENLQFGLMPCLTQSCSLSSPLVNSLVEWVYGSLESWGLICISFELSWHQHRALYIATANYWAGIYWTPAANIPVSRADWNVWLGHVGNRSKNYTLPSSLLPVTDILTRISKMNVTPVLSFSFLWQVMNLKCFPNNLLYWKVWNRRPSLLKLTCVHIGSAFASWMTLSCNRKLLSLDFFSCDIGNFASLLRSKWNNKYEVRLAHARHLIRVD